MYQHQRIAVKASWCRTDAIAVTLPTTLVAQNKMRLV
jgi:hypothetical protein